MKVGRPRNEEKDALVDMLQIPRSARAIRTAPRRDQLFACKDDSACRLLLAKGAKSASEPITTDAGVIIWFAQQLPGRIPMRRIVAAMGDQRHRLDHLCQLKMLRKQYDFVKGEMMYSLVKHAHYRRQPWKQAA